MAIGERGLILKTTDGGENWIEQTETSNALIGIYFINENDIVIVGENGLILKTSDGGENWDNQTKNIITTGLSGISQLDANTSITVGENGTILKTNDGGKSWNKKFSGISNNINAVHFTNNNLGWAVGDSGKIIKTADGGESWAVQNSGTSEKLMGVSFVDENTGWASGCFGNCLNGIVLKTTDGGENWDLILDYPPPGDFRGIYFRDLNNGVVVGNPGIILYTTNGGSNWNKTPSGTQDILNSVFFIDENNGWIAGGYWSLYTGVILRTTNGGISWITQLSGQVPLFGVSFKDLNNGIAVGRNGAILRTTDSGENWVLEQKGTNEYTAVSFNNNTGVIVGDKGTILKISDDLTDTKEDQYIIPKEFLLTQNYPNPFNPSTTISWQSPVGSWQTLKVYDMLGREVATLVDEFRPAGSYEVEFDASSLSSGTYFYRLTAGAFVVTKKLILMK